MNLYLNPRSTRLRQSHRETKGFTLIELLVVIAIIAILAAILFPVFARARENARRSSCQSNLKQVGLGLVQYTQDFDESLPPAFVGGTSNYASSPTPGNNYKWMDAIYPYVKSEQVFNCPSDPFVSRGGQYTYYTNLTADSNFNYGSYAINFLYRRYNDPAPAPRVTPSSDLTPLGASTPVQVVKLSSIAVPSTTFWVGDSAQGISRPAVVGGGIQRDYLGFMTVAYNVGPQFSPDATPNGIAAGDGLFTTNSGGWGSRHLETMNVLWCDGHVKAMKAEALVPGGSGKFFTTTDD